VSWLDRFRAGHGQARVGPVSVDHAPRLAEIHAGAFARPWSTEDFERFLLDRAIRADGLFLGRERDPAGFAVSRTVLDEAEVLSVALARPARGRGPSGTLLAYHIQALAHAGIARIHLEVEDGNLPALALYRRFGFVQSGVRPGYYARPDGTRATAMSMTRILSGSDAGFPSGPAR
jgi:ribosomal-protein-alanine N-acetyltransferase